MLVVGQIAVECFDERLVGQLPFLLISRTVECDHPRCCCLPQQLKCQTSLAHTGIPCEEKHLPASLPGGAEPRMHGLESALASDQWGISQCEHEALHAGLRSAWQRDRKSTRLNSTHT